MDLLKKITSSTNNVFLFEDIPNERRNNLGIASGESVLLSIYDSDSFYFTKDINLISYSEIVKEESPSDLEIAFFELVKKEKEIKFKKKIVDEYQIGNYIRYLPKITFKQQKKDTTLLITGTIKNPNPESIHEFELPKISFNGNVLPLDENMQFKCLIPNEKTPEKLEFTLDFPKQSLVRSYKVK